METPDAFARAHIECLDITWRIVAIAQAVADPVADDDKVAVHHRRRGVGVVRAVRWSTQLCREIHFAVGAE
jgi:hypothetical protein